MNVVLLAEDDERLAELVKDYLEANDFRVVIETQGYNVTRQILNLQPDIVILDVMLPGKDGVSICREVRPQYAGPILMLTARDADADQILGLEVGADDYVIKPAEPRVLLRSEEHTSELQSRENLVCRLLLEKKKTHRSMQ